MRPFPRFLVFFLGCLAVAVVLTPPVYLLVQSSAGRSDAAWLHHLASHPFHRYFNRVLQISLLASVWWLLEGTDPDALGAYIDPGHMTIEGGGDLWRQGMELLGPRTNLMAVESVGWLYEPNVGRVGRCVNRMMPLY